MLSKFALSITAFSSVLQLINAIETIPLIHQGCFKTKGCITPVTTCIKNDTCDLMMTHSKEGDYYAFELMAKMDGDSGYVAMGLSEDSRMGQDLVIECVKHGSKMEVHQSWNDYYKNYRIPGTHCSKTGRNKGLVNCTVIVENRKIYCRFKRYRKITHEFMGIGRVDISSSHHFVTLVRGTSISSDNIGKHTSAPFVTKNRINFLKVVQDDMEDPRKIMTHVYTMILCWMIFVPNAMFVARYLKETMTTTACCDRKLWFFGHSGLMTIGFLLCMTGIGFILWNKTSSDPKWPVIPSSTRHAQIGTVAISIFMIQAVSGWYRPMGHPSKKTYSLLHASLGTIAYCLGVTNLIQSYYMGMPCYVYWIIIGSFTWNGLWNFFMILHFIWLDKNLGLKKCRALSPTPIKVVLFDDAPGKKQRLRITIINLIGSIMFAIGLCLYYHFGESCPCEIDYCRRIVN